MAESTSLEERKKDQARMRELEQQQNLLRWNAAVKFVNELPPKTRDDLIPYAKTLDALNYLENQVVGTPKEQIEELTQKKREQEDQLSEKYAVKGDITRGLNYFLHQHKFDKPEVVKVLALSESSKTPTSPTPVPTKA